MHPCTSAEENIQFLQHVEDAHHRLLVSQLCLSAVLALCGWQGTSLLKVCDATYELSYQEILQT